MWCDSYLRRAVETIRSELPKDEDGLVEALRSPSAAKRSAAILALAQIKGRDVIPYLQIRATMEDHPTVRATLVKTLGQFGRGTSQVLEHPRESCSLGCGRLGHTRYQI